MKLLRKALVEGSFLLNLDARDLPSIFGHVLDLLIARRVLPAEARQEVLEYMLEREAQASTAIGHSAAVPHAYLDVFTEPAIVFARLRHPLNLGAPDGVPVRFLLVLVGPTTGRPFEHLDTLTNIARLVSDDEFRYEAAVARSQLDLLAALDRFRQRTVPHRPPQRPGIAEGLQFHWRPLAGLIGDIRRRWPHYASDFTDGLHPKCVATTLFLFFACLAPTVAFGGLLLALTNGQIGVIETILATGLGGVLYALLSGQPLTIVATTGPIAIFLGLLYDVSVRLQVPFLPLLGWVGLWTALFVLLIALLNLTAVVRYCTRFTDEIFAALIAVIYIAESTGKLIELVTEQPTLNELALLSVLLGFGTLFIALSLSRFRRSRYLLPQIREFLADFGPAIALGLMALVAIQVRDEVPLQGLEMRGSFTPTADRAWLVNLSAAEPWVRLAAAAPALLATLLVFLDQNITVRLVNNAEHRLQKGPGYHLDMAVIGVSVGLFSLFGLPWVVAATVRSLNHVRSLATVEDVISEEGDTQERIIHTRENRLTTLLIGLLVALSLLLAPLLEMVPMAALYGLFLYMGIVSMQGNQFFERMKLWLTDPALYPSTHYIRRVPTRLVHAYTLLQLVCLVVLWLVRISALGILFPLFIAVLVPVRMLAARFFPHEHLAVLDAEEQPEEEETQWT